MKKYNILLIFLVIFFVSLSSVSAMDNNAIITNDNQVVEDNPIQLSVGDSDAILAEDVVIVGEGSSIQSAIDNAAEGSTIIVQNGTYSEDLIVSKGLSIVGQDAILKSNNIAFNILQTANSTSISGFNIAVSSNDGVGILVNASDCTIAANEISGGKIGIWADAFISIKEMKVDTINTISVIGNNISNCGETGISIIAFNPTVSQNTVTNVANKKGDARGIKVRGLGVFNDGLNVVITDNTVSNIEASHNAHGIDVWGASVFDYANFDVSGNTISGVTAPHTATGMTAIVGSLNSKLPSIIISDLNISDISSRGQENSAATGLKTYVIAVGQDEASDVVVENLQINNLEASGTKSSVTGITAIGVGCVDLYVLNNNIDNLKSSNLARGINVKCLDYSKFRSFVSVSNNKVTNFDASKIRGILVFSVGDAEINKNLLYNLPSEDSTFITGITFRLDLGKVLADNPESESDDLLSLSLDDIDIPIDKILELLHELEAKLNDTSIIVDGSLTMTGNNLEGTGIETGFKVLRPATITYNRATNLKDNVVKESTRSFLLESLGINPDTSSQDLIYSFIRSQKIFDSIPDDTVKGISDYLGGLADKFFDQLDDVAEGDVDAKYNWWGTNSMPSASKFQNNKGSVFYDPWLTLRVNADPNLLGLGESSEITADVYIDSAGTDHSFDKFSYFSGPRVTLSTDKGSFDGEKSVTLNWTYGQASASFKGDEVGLANISAFDYDTAYTNVTVLGDNSTPEKNVASAKTLPATANPIALLFVLVILLGSVNRFKRE